MIRPTAICSIKGTLFRNAIKPFIRNTPLNYKNIIYNYEYTIFTRNIQLFFSANKIFKNNLYIAILQPFRYLYLKYIMIK